MKDFTTSSIVQRSSPWRPAMLILPLIYLLSGGCSLIYQTVWIRLLSLVFGSTILSMSIVLAIFFAGLALGSYFFGKRSRLTADPVRLYGWLEIATALYALGLPYLLKFTEYVYAAVLPAAHSNFAVILGIKAVTAAIILLPPTILMGGTLPVLSCYVVSSVSKVGSRIGIIYGLNTLGASLGCLISGYYLLHTVGAHQTNTLAALLNLGLGMSALILATKTKIRHGDHQPMPQPQLHAPTTSKNIDTREVSENSPGYIRLVMICFAVSGFVSIAYEIIWLRYLSLYFRDSSHLYTGIITVFILGLAIGSFCFSRIANRTSLPQIWLGLLQLGIGIFTVAGIYLPISHYNSIQAAGQSSPGYILVFLFAVLFIPTFFMGGTFPLTARIITTRIDRVGSQIGTAYSLNILGSILGSLAAGFIFFLFMGLQSALWILFGLNMFVASILFFQTGGQGARFAGGLALLLAFLFPASGHFFPEGQVTAQLIRQISPMAEIVEISESLTGTSWITRARYRRSGKDDQDQIVSLLENRVIISRSDSSGFVIQGTIPMLLTGKPPESILGLCFGGGLSYLGGRLFPEVKQMDMVDISPDNIRLALDHIPQNKGFRQDPRVRFIQDDAYNFVKYISRKYDIIIMDPTPPVFSYKCASLYTREFYTFAQKRLNIKGIFSQVLPLKHMSVKEVQTVMRTFTSVFDHCLLWWNGFEPVMLGSMRKFTFKTGEINRRITRPEIYSHLKEYSKKADYSRLSHFLSGLLLTTADFKKVSGKGELYTNDLNRLELSSLAGIGDDTITMINNNLSPWNQLVELFQGPPVLGEYIPQLTARRQYLMQRLYRDGAVLPGS